MRTRGPRTGRACGLVVLVLVGCGFRQGAAGNGDASAGGTDGSGSHDAPKGSADAPKGSADAPRGGSDACVAFTLPPTVNVDPSPLAAQLASAPTWSCSGSSATTIDSHAGTVSGGTCTLDASSIAIVPQTTATASSVLVVLLRGLTLSGGYTFTLVGDKPIVFLVAGNVSINGGTIDASANHATAGPGGFTACATQALGAGQQGKPGDWGGGGGGFGGSGGVGEYNLTNGGSATTDRSLVPLQGGCQGGPGANGAGNPNGDGVGAGGGAVEISASGTIAIGGTTSQPGVILASGGGAPAGTTGGNGGGAGGGILLVAPAMPGVSANGALRANGGAGSEGNSQGNTNAAGNNGSNNDTAATDTSGIAGGGNGDDHGRVGGLAYMDGSTTLSTGSASETTTQLGGRGGGGGGGGLIVLTTASTTQGCE